MIHTDSHIAHIHTHYTYIRHIALNTLTHKTQHKHTHINTIQNAVRNRKKESGRENTRQGARLATGSCASGGGGRGGRRWLMDLARKDTGVLVLAGER